MARTIRLNKHRVLIKAPREMVYRRCPPLVEGGFRATTTSHPGSSPGKARSLSRSSRPRRGPSATPPSSRSLLTPPERITFVHLKGPLHYVWEEFAFSDVDGDTELVHSGEFIWNRLPILGWLGGLLYAKPMFEKVIRKHMDQIKAGCEARASRSHVLRSGRSARPNP